ncbi:MAG: type I methionyl aminopeptidase [Spirochaetes bacterium GWF1_51_8]|nr:MAG: type I methionyl aminopeptidase [Spirochaetes bacterium GWF1_51_8]
MFSLKTPVEIEYLKKSNQIIAKSFDLIKPLIKPGTKTKEIDAVVEDFIRAKGARPSYKGYSPGRGFKPFPAATCISVNEEVIHGIPGEYALKEGDIVSVDIGTELAGYYGDATYNYIVGETTPEAKALVEDTQKALSLAIDVCREGNYLNEIGKAISLYLSPRGYGIIRDYCGHGVGKAVHEEPPVLNYYDPKRKGPKLKKGLVIAIEPMITLGHYAIELKSDGWTVVTRDRSLASHWEHSIAITDGEPIILSGY